MKMIHGTFLDLSGKMPHLKGETALINFNLDGTVNAQFDNREFIEAYGQWQFTADNFEMDYGTGSEHES
jgi:hypothetical protein